MHNSPAKAHPDLIVGFEGSDDAGVFRITDDIALVQSVDYFTPIVDDAYDWGRIAAANALSDIYAMGAVPLTALHIAGWPREALPFELLTSVLEGSVETLNTASVTLLGGHSLDDPEPKFGLAVTGTVHPEAVVRNRGAKPGDVLVLTKPIGTGIASTALKRGALAPELTAEATRWMASLNDRARDAMVRTGVSAATDVTGFGLLGHLHEMVDASGVGAVVDSSSVPLLPESRRLVGEGFIPGGTRRNLTHCETFTDFGPADATTRTLLADAQTSGGLLLAASPAQAAAIVAELGEPVAVIGEVGEGQGIEVT